jgi:hypothetical protein
MQAERVWSLNGIRREVPFLLNLVLYVSLTTSMVQKYNQRCRNRDNGQTMFASPHFFRQKFKKKMNFQQKRIVQLTNCKGVRVCKVFFALQFWRLAPHPTVWSTLRIVNCGIKNSWVFSLWSLMMKYKKKMYNLLWSARLIYFYQIYSTKFYSRKLNISPFSFQFPLECYVKQ